MSGLHATAGKRPAKLTTNASLAALLLSASLPVVAVAEAQYFSLKQVFPSGKCSAMIPYFELMKDGFGGGEITQFKIYDTAGKEVEVLTSFVSKNRDQWALVGSKTETTVIFCLYASGIGKDSVNRLTANAE